MRLRTAILGLSFFIAASFLLTLARLIQVVGEDLESEAKSGPSATIVGGFVPVLLDRPISSSAASGLAVAPGLLGVANFYGRSALYSLNARSAGLDSTSYLYSNITRKAKKQALLRE